MTRRTARRTNPTVENLEDRALQSGVVTPTQLPTTVALPYIEQDSLRATGNGQVTRVGTRSIIAIL